MANRYALFRFSLFIWLALCLTLVAEAQINCPAPTNVTVTNITATSAMVSFNAPTNATASTVIYMPPGVSPSLGVAVTGTRSPIVLTGLVGNTTYSLCIQTTCGAGSQSALVCPITFTTKCYFSPIYPYLETFDTAVAPALPCNYEAFDANSDGAGWHNYNSTISNMYVASAANAMRYDYSTTNAADDWFFTNGLLMTAGLTYQLWFKYRAFSSSYPEGLEVKIGSAATSAGQTRTLFTNTNIINTTYTTAVAGGSAGQVMSFSPSTSGVYYVGFHAISAANMRYLYVDDIVVNISVATANKSKAFPGFRAEASPVPFGQQLTLSLNTQQAGPLQLTLHDAVGRAVRQHSTMVPAGASSLAVPDVAALPVGVYLLTVRQGGATQVIRVAHE